MNRELEKILALFELRKQASGVQFAGKPGYNLVEIQATRGGQVFKTRRWMKAGEEPEGSTVIQQGPPAGEGYQVEGEPSVHAHVQSQSVLQEFTTQLQMNKRSQFLSPYKPDDLKEDDVFLFDTPYGKAGYAIRPDGYAGSLFNNSQMPGLGAEMIVDAALHGATHGDCYDGYLPEYYKKFGMVETHRDKWDDKYAPENWDYANHGKPDIVYVEYKGTSNVEEARKNAEANGVRFPSGGREILESSRRSYLGASGKKVV
jgi:hypothetical protein